MRNNDGPLSTGLGVLKTLLGTYVLIIVTVFSIGSKHQVEQKETIPIESEAEEDYIVLSYNDKLFAVEYESYNSFKKSDEQNTVLIDALDQETSQTIINKNDIEEIKLCSSYEEAVNYITEQNDNKIELGK